MTTMPLGKKIALVAAALLVSLAAASIFRRDVPLVSDIAGAATDQTRQFVEPVTRRLTAGSAARPPRAHTPFHLAPQPDHAFAAPPAATGVGTRELAGMPLSYQRALSPVGALLRPQESVEPSEISADGAETSPELFPATGPPPAASSQTILGPAAVKTGPRTHHIVDGDTLTKLAAEYLGSSERYLEIYALNRDILNSPDLLPIGKTLKIPASGNESDPAGRAASKLVPIPAGTLRRASD